MKRERREGVLWLTEAHDRQTAAVGGRWAKERRRSGLASLAAAAAVLSIVFLISVGASWLGAQTLDVLHGFGGNDGAYPEAGVIEASDGALYGATTGGGKYCNPNCRGVIYKMNKDGTGFRKVHDFNQLDGDGPAGLLLEASDGTLYGTTIASGHYPGGTVFKVNKDGTGFQVLHDFGGSDGASPWAGLIEASDGALYGTTTNGGAYSNGVIFRLNKDGAGFEVLHEFGGTDGAVVFAGLIEASDGALYGTTYSGGAYGAGVAFKLNKDGTGFVGLHDFDGSTGANPYAGVIEASDGALYGTALYGAYALGVLYQLGKDGAGFQVLHDFDGSDGAYPHGGVFEASDGAFYGTTLLGGLGGDGVAFRLTPGCDVALRTDGEVHTPGSMLALRVHLAHHRLKTVTVPWELRLLDEAGRNVATHTTEPHTFEPGDVVDKEVRFRLPDGLAAGTYTLELGISGMAGTKGATTTFQVRAE